MSGVMLLVGMASSSKGCSISSGKGVVGHIQGGMVGFSSSSKEVLGSIQGILSSSSTRVVENIRGRVGREEDMGMGVALMVMVPIMCDVVVFDDSALCC